MLCKARRLREQGGTIEPMNSKTASSWTVASGSITTDRPLSGKPRSEMESISEGDLPNSELLYFCHFYLFCFVDLFFGVKG